MASIAKFDTWQDSSSRAFYGARAWVNFNGTGVVAIRASSGVSSITDLGTGQYAVNFSSALPDASYCGQTNCGHPGGGGTALYSTVDVTGVNQTTASRMAVFVLSNTNAQVDGANVFASVFR